ncbi:MAG: hypothetical protein IJ568_03055 [Bacilli bacterium]|nr:hypothetical protein [Bacilli bacterium]
MEEEKEVKEVNENGKKSKGNKVFIVEIIIISLFLAFGSGFILRDRLGKDNKECTVVKEKSEDNDIKVDENDVEKKDNNETEENSIDVDNKKDN